MVAVKQGFAGQSQGFMHPQTNLCESYVGWGSSNSIHGAVNQQRLMPRNEPRGHLR